MLKHHSAIGDDLSFFVNQLLQELHSCDNSIIKSNKVINMRVDVFKRTSDDWFPSYSLQQWNKGVESQMLVEVTFCTTGPKPPHNGDWRVCAWGGDDCGMEKDFKDETLAWNCFLQVIGMEEVTMKALEDMGFVSA